jgi:hypothetical protein
MTHVAKGRGQLVAALGRPQERALGIAARGGRDEALEVGEQARIAVGQRSRAAALAPHASGRRQRCIEFFEPAPDRRMGKPVICETAAIPPWPAPRASLAANTRRPRSSHFDPSASYRCSIPARSIMPPKVTRGRRTKGIARS